MDSLRAHAKPCGLIIVVGLLLFGRVVFFDFVHYDDWEFLDQHAASLANLNYVVSSFWRDAFAVLGPEARGVFYRPILILTYGVEAQLMGANPLIYHATNLGLHLVVSCLVYLFLWSFGSTRPLSLGLALVFLCHPCAAQVPAWIPCRNDALLAIWFIVGALCMRGFMREGRHALLASAVLCYAGAIFTKEPGGLLLGILGAIALLELPGRPQRRRALLIAVGAVGGVTVLWAGLRAFALGGSPVGASRILDNFPVLFVYLGKTLFPVNLAVVPHPADTSLVPGVAAAVVLVGAAGFAWRRLWGPAGLGLLWYGAILAPVLLAPEQTWGLEHRIYVPLVGLLLFVAWLPVPGWLPPLLAPALAVAVASLFGVLSTLRLSDYSDPISYWESAVVTAPSSPIATSRIAWRYYDARRFAEMQVAIDHALEVNPEDGEMYLLRGIEAGNNGHLEDAERHFERAVELAPKNAAAWENLAKLQDVTGKRMQSRASQKKADDLRHR